MDAPKAHPAKWSAPILEKIGEVLAAEAPDGGRLLDPFAGVGLPKLRLFAGSGWDVYGVELEPEWGAASDPRCIVGDSTRLPFATDLDLTLRTNVPADVSVKGETTVRAALLHDLCRSFKSPDVTLNAAAAGLKVIAGAADFDLAVLAADEFPAVPRIADAAELVLPEAELHALLRRTAFARSTDEARFVLNGSLIRLAEGKIYVAACDGRRLAVEEAKTAAGKLTGDLNLPGKAVNELLRLLSTNEDKPRKVTLRFNKQAAQFTFGEQTLITKLIEGDYPDFTQIIPAMADGAAMDVNRPELLACVQRVALIAEAVRLEFRPQGLIISSHQSAGKDLLGKSTESMLVGGQTTATTHLATRLLLDALSAAGGEQIHIYPSDTAPIAFHDPASTWLAVIASLKA